MIRTRTRRMTEEEKKIFFEAQKALKSVTNHLVITGSIIVAVSLLFFGVLWLIGIKNTGAVEKLAFIPIAFLGLTLFVYLKWRGGASNDLKDTQADLGDGVVVESTYSAIGAIRVKEFEDLGYNFYIRLHDRQVLFLAGQFLYENVNDNRFPCSEFTITSGRRTGIILDFKCAGEYITPAKTLQAFTKEDLKNGTYPDNLVIVKTSWDDLLAGKR